MKFAAALLFALSFNFIFIVGLKAGYLEAYGIKMFFNPLFMIMQPWIYLFFFIPTLLVFYLPKKLAVTLFVTLSLCAISSFIFPKKIGYMLYGSVQSYQIGKYEVNDITLLFNYKERDFVLFEGATRAKEFEKSKRKP
ncbi:MAG: hypothetical protein ACQESH_02885 [Campylobacterota bacterium]